MIPATPNTPAEPAIKPCPFCDYVIVPPIVRWDMRNFRQRGRYCRVVCACGAKGPDRETERAAIAAWNHRREKGGAE